MNKITKQINTNERNRESAADDDDERIGNDEAGDDDDEDVDRAHAPPSLEALRKDVRSSSYSSFSLSCNRQINKIDGNKMQNLAISVRSISLTW